MSPSAIKFIKNVKIIILIFILLINNVILNTGRLRGQLLYLFVLFLVIVHPDGRSQHPPSIPMDGNSNLILQKKTNGDKSLYSTFIK